MTNTRLVLPRNVPPENFKSATELYTRSRRRPSACCRLVMLVSVVMIVSSLLIFTLLSAVSLPASDGSDTPDCGPGLTRELCHCEGGHNCTICPEGREERQEGCRDLTQEEEEEEEEEVLMADRADREVERCVTVCDLSPPSPCLSSPCQAGGSCEDHDGTFTCYCREGRGGQLCEERLDTNTTVPAFHGKSFIQLHLGRPGLAGLRADLRLEFRTFLSSCLLYHSPGGQRRSGDFLSLSVRDKHLEFSFSLSGAKLRLVSEEPVMLGRWHSVRVQRYRTHAMLQLDDLQPVRGQTQSSLSTLDLAHVSYLGHSPSLSLPGLQGCVRSLRVGRSQVRLEGSSSHGVTSCQSHPCTSACHHPADCVSVWPPQSGRALCLCPPGYTGHHCQHRRDQCQPNPCHHGGVCHQEEGGVSCTCRRGFSGSLCHIKY